MIQYENKNVLASAFQDVIKYGRIDFKSRRLGNFSIMAEKQRLKANPSLCRDCQACTLACSMVHEGQCAPSLARLRVIKDMQKYQFQITYCRNCSSPACVEACPSNALPIDHRGVPILDDELCTRCGKCLDACPFDAIYFHQTRDRYLKCDLCVARAEGPACLQVCPVKVFSLINKRG